MKKVIDFLALPIMEILLVPLWALCMTTKLGYFFIVVYIAIQIFLGGYIVSKIENKRIIKASAIFTGLLFFAAGIAIYIGTFSNYDDAYSYWFISPINLLISSTLSFDLTSSISWIVYTAIAALKPVIPVISFKIYKPKTME